MEILKFITMFAGAVIGCAIFGTGLVLIGVAPKKEPIKGLLLIVAGGMILLTALSLSQGRLPICQ